jgi:membrane fusion protein
VASQQALRVKRQQLVRDQRDEAELAQEIAALRGAIQAQRQDSLSARITTERRLSELQAQRQTIIERRAQIEGERSTLIAAPVAGKVVALYATLGQDIEPGRSPLAILPVGGELEAELYVPTRAAGFIRPGQTAQLLYDAFPYQRFGTFRGTVTRITRAIISPEDALGPLRLAEPAYRVRVKIARQTVDAAGQQIPLQAGMLLRADIILERQPLLAWVTAPVKALLRGG